MERTCEIQHWIACVYDAVDSAVVPTRRDRNEEKSKSIKFAQQATTWRGEPPGCKHDLASSRAITKNAATLRSERFQKPAVLGGEYVLPLLEDFDEYMDVPALNGPAPTVENLDTIC